MTHEKEVKVVQDAQVRENKKELRETVNTKKKDKILVVYSGGLDSTTALYLYRHLGYEVEAVSFNYGQRHSIELEKAGELCKELEIKHHIMDVPIPSSNSCLVDLFEDVPKGHYEDKTMKKTVVNNRNAIMISLATALAIDIKAVGVAVGIHAGDHAIYADCRKKFFMSMNDSMIYANEGLLENNFRLRAPFITADKNDIAELAILLDVPVEKTYSDYEGGKVQRGCSGTSVERIEAVAIGYQRYNTLISPFKSHHNCDKTEYVDKEFALNLLIEKRIKERTEEIINTLNWK